MLRRVAMVPGVGMVSAGMDARVVITDMERWEASRQLRGHERGIYSFAYYSHYRCLLTAGFDREVILVS